MEQELILEYTGHPTFSTIGRLLLLLKKKVKEKGISVSIYKKIISLMIESLENIYKYVDQYHDYPFIFEKYTPTFILTRQGEKYYIRVSNPIRIDDAAKLKARLDLVNSKTYEQLRALYLHTISDGKFTPKGGAGLGIIEMAKIANEPLDYSFKPINEMFNEYVLKITI